MPLSSGHLLWENFPAHMPVNSDTVSPYFCGDKQMNIENDRTVAWNAPFPDQGHRAAIRAFGRTTAETGIKKCSAISDKVSGYWREQMLIVKLNGN